MCMCMYLYMYVYILHVDPCSASAPGSSAQDPRACDSNATGALSATADAYTAQANANIYQYK